MKSSSNAGVFYDGGAVPIIVDVIKAYPNSSNVIQHASWAIRNMSVRNRRESQEFIVCGIEELLNNALKNYSEQHLQADIKAALRDLGLKVELKEQWTGKNRSLSYD